MTDDAMMMMIIPHGSFSGTCHLSSGSAGSQYMNGFGFLHMIAIVLCDQFEANPCFALL